MDPSFNALAADKVFRGSSLQYMGVGPSISIPIFDGGRLKSNLVLQEARQQESAIAYQKAVLQAWHDVVNALVALKGDQGRRERLQRQVVDARQALTLARARYTQGVDTFTTVLQNLQTVLGAEMNLSQATAGISTDFVALYKALGGGWETTFPDRPERAAAAGGCRDPGEGPRAPPHFGTGRPRAARSAGAAWSGRSSAGRSVMPRRGGINPPCAWTVTQDETGPRHAPLAMTALILTASAAGRPTLILGHRGQSEDRRSRAERARET